MADALNASRASSASKQAWAEANESANDKDQLYDKDEGDRPKTAPQVASDHDAPTAMESEVFDKEGKVHVQQKYAKSREPQGCWYKFKKGIRAIWQTKHTEDTAYDRELYIKTTLRELVIYVLFLLTLCIITFGMTTTSMFYFTKVMQELFVNDDYEGMHRIQDFWDYVEGPMLDGLYWERWYDNRTITADKIGFIYYENKLLGLPRMRMVKVRNDSCTVPSTFEKTITECYDAFSSGNEDTQAFGPKNSSFKWIDGDEMDADSLAGTYSTYTSGGFRALLSMQRFDSVNTISFLKNNRWVDRGTRAVIVDFTVYNANLNLFCVISLIFEFPPTGGLLSSYKFRTVKLIRYVSTMDYVVMACEGIFVAFIIYYLIEEALEISKHKIAYFFDFWNILDVFVLTIAVSCIVFTVYRTIMIEHKLDQLLLQSEVYANFEFLSFAQNLFNDATAIMVFFAWVKIFKYISFNKTMNQLSSTLSRCAKDVGGFSVMFFIFFFAYAQLGYLIFGNQVRDFSTFYDSVFTLLRTILGDFNFRELEKASRFLGPAFFITYIFFVFFILLNMFLAIINDTYAEVKAELATQKDEFELGDYFKRSYYNMLRKLNLRKDRIVDIQAVLSSEDSGKQIDFDEWRDQLKKRGYAEGEIEAMFAKYDMDGSRVLDEQEMTQMKKDLQGLAENLDDMGQGVAGDGFQGDEDDELRGGLGGPGGRGVPIEEFNVMTRRVDRVENSITSVIAKIDAAIHKLESLDRLKMQHRERMTNIMQNIATSETSESDKVEKLEAAVTDEMDKFNKDAGGGKGILGGMF